MDIKELRKIHDASIGDTDAVETALVDWLMGVPKDEWEEFHRVLDELDETEDTVNEAVMALATIGLQRIAGLCLERKESA